MNKNILKGTLYTSLLTAVTLTGCGGGGGGGSTPPMGPNPPGNPNPVTSPVMNPTPTTSATPLPASSNPPSATPAPSTPTPTAPPAAANLAIQGRVLNKDTGAPLPGAVVYVSHQLQSSNTAPMSAPADGGEVTTAADGTYTMSLPAQGTYPSTFYIEVYSQSKVTVHGEISVSSTMMNPIRDLSLTTLTTDEANWLVTVNQDRAKYGRNPLYSDETTQEVARLWVAFMATGYYEHFCTSGDKNCPDKQAYIASQFAPFTATGENIAGAIPPSAYTYAENEFMAEAANCPQPANPSTCPFAENTGHFLNIENSGVIWGGVAESFNGIDFRDSTKNLDYYDMEFSYPNRSGQTVNAKLRK